MSTLDDLILAARRMVLAPFDCSDASIRAAYEELYIAVARHNEAAGDALTHSRTDDSAPVRRDAHQTSREAGKRVYKRGHLRAEILRAFEAQATHPVIVEDLRPIGFADYELAAMFPDRDVRTVGSARQDLKLDGWVEESDVTIENPRTGRACIVWTLTPAARARLTKGE